LLNANVEEFKIDAPLLRVIVPEEGENEALAPTVRVPPIVKLLEVVTVAEFPIVKSENPKVPELLMDPPLLNVIVPPEGLKLLPVPTDNDPFTPKLLLVVTVALFAIVRLLNVSVPEFDTEEPLFIVTVPLVGVNVPVTVKTPPTVPVFEAPVIEPLTFKFPYVTFDNTCPDAVYSTVKFVSVFVENLY